MMIVFAFGMSRPLSMIVVDSSTSASPFTNAVITSSSSSACICPWPTTIRACGTSPRNFCAIDVNGADAVVQKKNLPAAVHFPLDGVADQPLVVLRHDGFHRQPVLRRRFNRAHVARAGQREIQRARNRRRAQRQHVHQPPQAA